MRHHAHSHAHAFKTISQMQEKACIFSRTHAGLIGFDGKGFFFTNVGN